jgi:hypothetical protein
MEEKKKSWCNLQFNNTVCYTSTKCSQPDSHLHSDLAPLIVLKLKVLFLYFLAEIFAIFAAFHDGDMATPLLLSVCQLL